MCECGDRLCTGLVYHMNAKSCALDAKFAYLWRAMLSQVLVLLSISCSQQVLLSKTDVGSLLKPALQAVPCDTI